MNARHMTAIIDDVVARNIDAQRQAHLLDLFTSTMKSVAATLAHEARFETSDYATAKARQCEGFELRMRRTFASSRTDWRGIFTRGDERLEVVGHLEK